MARKAARAALLDFLFLSPYPPSGLRMAFAFEKLVVYPKGVDVAGSTYSMNETFLLAATVPRRPAQSIVAASIDPRKRARSCNNLQV
jgi:hypothetical protein